MMYAGGEVFFILFWSITAAAILWHRRQLVRRGYLFVFMACLLVPGLMGNGRWFWPFHEWHLWGGVRAHEGEYVELLVVDSHGHELLYDCRAVPPKLPTQTQWMAGWLLDDQNKEHHQALVRFLLGQANDFRDKVLNDAACDVFMSFPPREIGRRWSKMDVEEAGEFVAIKARRVHFNISDEGRHAEHHMVMEQTFP